jgi:hypothetical protein
MSTPSTVRRASAETRLPVPQIIAVTVLRASAGLGCPRIIAAKTLNLVDGSVDGIYDRHSYADEAQLA